MSEQEQNPKPPPKRPIKNKKPPAKRPIKKGK